MKGKGGARKGAAELEGEGKRKKGGVTT